MKKSIDIVHQLIRYFDVQVIGSQLLVDAGLLHYDETNDIDISIVKGYVNDQKITSFLTDIGFTKKDIPDQFNSRVVRSEFSHPEYDKVIDLNFAPEIQKVYTLPELIKAKFEQGRPNDLKQISMAVFNTGGNVLKSYKELQEFYLNNKPDGESI